MCIRDRNVRDLCGKPLFVWSAIAGLACPQIARTIVSTDSAEYQRIAIAAGADCPWLRNPALAADSTSSADVVKELLDRLGEEVKQYRALVLLQPTSPLRTADDIHGALALFESRNAPAVVSVSEAECPPAWTGRLPDNLLMDKFVPAQFRSLRSQDPVSYTHLDVYKRQAVNSALVKNPGLAERIASIYGSQCLVGSIEAKRRGGSWEAYISNGREPTGRDVVEWAKELELRGVGELLVTSVDQEGTQRGFDVELCASVEAAVRIPVVASGGAGKLEHLQYLDTRTELQGVAIASLLHYNKASVAQLKSVLPNTCDRQQERAQ